ncbi:NACHT domain-containing protein [Paractinoplanes toevensis]|uniref:NACHT domain-containing protein n=1 Tax=Paractinoplanes toevensis TaxID=571911 RepID=A0A919TI81_9ACTN|nr:NACHT domain-containing protein [Actinoplanes toevensis]GIM95431.1 hypothetical protein Ato02nite_072240 [Actinoplanes toevensis]
MRNNSRLPSAAIAVVGAALAVYATSVGVGSPIRWIGFVAATAVSLLGMWFSRSWRARQERTPWDLDIAMTQLADAERNRTEADRRGRDQEASLVKAFWRGQSGRLGPRRPLKLHDDPGTQMVHEFRQLSSRRMCILGAAGSGKSTLALALIEGLLRERQPDEPVPVLLPLAGWDPRSEPLEAWISRRLAELFPVLVASGEQTASMLVSDGRVLPVLDGLDELPADLRTAALARLAGSRLARRPYVLTSRTEAFDQAMESTGYPLDMAILELRPITPRAVAGYLSRHQSADDRRWDPVLLELTSHPHGLLAQALSAPWAAYAMRMAYSGRSTDPAELVDYDRFPSAAAMEGHLLDVWLDSLVDGPRTDVVRRGRARFEPAATRHWLAWLANHMRDTGQRQVAWWDLGRTLPRPLRLGTYAVPLTALLLFLDQRVGVAVVITAALTIPLDQARGPEPRQLTRPALRRGVLRTAAGLGAAVALVTFLTLVLRPLPIRPWALALAMVPVLVAAILYVIADSVTVPVKEPGGTFTEQLHRDRRALWTRAAAAATAAGAWTSAMVVDTLSHRVLTVCVAAAATFLIVAMTGNASGPFGIARIWLALHGRMPWRLITFIAHANTIGVLRSEAGHIEFRYASLQDMLASPQAVDRGPAIEPALARAIVEEVCVLPEVAVRLAADDSARNEIEDRARMILAERPDEVLGRGQEDLARYRLAHNRLVLAVGRPGWTRLAPMYRIVAWLSLSLAVLGAGLRFLPRLGFAVVSAVALVGAAVLLTRALRHRRRLSTSVKRAPRWWDAGWPVLAAIVAGIAFAVPERHAHGPAVLVVLFVVAVCWPLAVVALLLSRPHERVQRRLAGDDPTYWPDAPGTGQLRTAAEQARQDWITALARFGVMPLLRYELAANTDLFSTVLPRFDPSRLGGVSRVDQLVETAATRQLSRYLRDLSSVSVGISGSRGAGKSTVLQRFCTAQFTRTTEDLLLLVPAPTAYDRREFLIHLFAEICEKVVGDDDSDRPPRRRVLGAATRALPGALVVGGLVTALLAWAWPRVVSTAQLFAMGNRTAVIVGGLAATALGLALALLGSRSGDRTAQRSVTTQQMAAAQLRRLRYQLSTTAIRGGKIGLAAGAEFNASANTQRTELQRSYPELVADFRELLQQVALERRSVGRRVIIGIDELDKIASAADAERFLNDLKVIFGIPGCYFLVAVSDDALVAFDRRALAVRTTFDSAFDQIISVPPLALDEARELLSLRGVFLPEPYLWLCHALSGGLPRDLLRSVLQLATTSTDQHDDLPVLALRLIESDVRSVLRAQLHQAEVSADLERPVVTAWLALGADGETSSAILERMAESAPVLDAKSTLTHLVAQSCGYARYAATLIRTFADEAPGAVDWLRGQGASVDLLASARSQLSTSTDSALTRVQRFREKAPFLAATAPADGQVQANGAAVPPGLN